MFKIYGAQWCTFCNKAKQFLDTTGYNYEFVDIESDVDACKFLLEEDANTIPQVYKDGILVGGYSDLVAFEARSHI